jgi:hypothetical protein
MIHSTRFFSVLIGIFCLFTTLVFEINRDVSPPKFLEVVDMMRGFFVNTASGQVAGRYLWRSKGGSTTASSGQQLEKQCFFEIVLDTGITYNKSGVADPNPVSGVSLTPEGGCVKAKKIYRLKEDQAFSLSLELSLKRKGCAASVCRFPPSLRWRGW